MKNLLPPVVLLLVSCYASNAFPHHFETEPSLCQNPVVDAAMNIENEVYFFQGEHYWVRSKRGQILDGPHLTVNRWHGAPPDMDAALKLNALQNATTFFKGNMIWAYSDDNVLLTGYPKRISDALPGMPSDISGTATYYWDDRLKDYLFKGNLYWYPGRASPQTIIAGWKLPVNTIVTAGFKYHNYTYFFSNDVYWKYEPGIDNLSVGYPPYPRSVAKYWFNCQDDDQL